VAQTIADRIESKSSILHPPPSSSPPSSTFLHPPPSSYVLLRPPSSSSIGLRLPLVPEPYTSRIRPRSLGRCDSRSENKILRRQFLLHMGRLAFSTCALTIMATESYSLHARTIPGTDSRVSPSVAARLLNPGQHRYNSVEWRSKHAIF